MKLSLTQNRVICTNPKGTHNMVYFDSEPEDSHKEVVFCVHGLLRNHKDFLPLAEFLSANGYRIILVDIVGRGQSDYLGAQKLYNYNQYVSDINNLFNKLAIEKVNWLGTSMGGLIGMYFAAYDKASRVSKLIVNDVSPRVSRKTLKKFFTNLALPPKAKKGDLLSVALERTKSFFAKNDQHLVKKYATNGLKRDSNGNYVFAYDPAIIDVPWLVKKLGVSIDLVKEWRALKCPLYIVKGQKSPLLTDDDITEMMRTQPQMQVHEVANVGHAPSLAKKDQQKQLLLWLKS